MRQRWMTGLVLGAVGALAVSACDKDPEADASDAGDAAQGDACEELGANAACEDGMRYCDDDPEGDGMVWGVCVTEPICQLNEVMACEVPAEFGGGTAEDTCVLDNGEPTWESFVVEEADCNTPLVLAFDGRTVQMEQTPATTFDIDGRGGCISTDWPTSVTPWLALDRDGSGTVEMGGELFGSGTPTASGARASNGFMALAELDSNGDGRLSRADARFSELVLWSDVDRDKRGTLTEFESLAARGILSIALDYRIDRECDDRGNCAVERATFDFIDKTGNVREGEVVDIHLACQ